MIAAMRDSGLEVGRDVDSTRLGCAIGSGVGGIQTFCREQLIKHRRTGTVIAAHIRRIRQFPAHPVMIDHYDIFRIKLCYIALAVLTVHRDQKLRLRQLRDMFHRDLQIIDHLQQIGFFHLSLAAIDKACINILFFQIPYQGKAAGQGIRIRIVMALHYDIAVIDQIF